MKKRPGKTLTGPIISVHRGRDGTDRKPPTAFDLFSPAASV